MRKKILILFLLILSQRIFGQSKPLIEQMYWLDFFTVKIWHGVERYESNEINVVYFDVDNVKIHSIFKSNYDKEKQIDTTFVLSGAQISKLDKFYNNFKQQTIPNKGIVIAGTRTIYSVTLNSHTSLVDNKSDYSLISDLLSE